jgi:hypothetical protein
VTKPATKGQKVSYSKRTSSGGDLIYRFAPPQTELDRAGKKVPLTERASGPKFPAELSRFTASVYYYWWEFLRLNDDYMTCCNKRGDVDDPHLRRLYDDFGDVGDMEPDASADVNFKLWWMKRGWVLFVEPDLEPDVKKQTSPFRDADDHGDRIYISMQRDIDPAKAAKEVKEYLKALNLENQVGRNTSRALYQPRHHKLTALSKYLTTKKAELKYLKENRSKPANSTLADLAGLNYVGKDSPRLNKNGKLVKEEAQRKVGAEAITAANNIIKHVIYGRFPITETDTEFDDLSSDEKSDAFPREPHYLRFSDQWLSAIGKRKTDFERPSLHRDTTKLGR